jgi:hypothetical protein
MANKTVYLRINGLETVAYEDQVTKGLWHIPPKATEVKPPSFTDKQTCKFIDDKWVVADIPEPEPEIPKEYTDYVPTYADKRALAYPPWQEQMDQQYWDSINGTTTWKDAIAKVKADYPKEAE